MFSIYVLITKGQRPSFKHFLCKGNTEIIISDKFLNNRLQCLCLYCCFHKAGNIDICKTLEKSLTFRDKQIHFRNNALTASDVECITVFLTSYCKEWMVLNLYGCYIQDHGLHLLHRGLLHYNSITIDQLVLEYNGLTMYSPSLISDITVKCKLKELIGISGNYTFGENAQLFSILSSSSKKYYGCMTQNYQLKVPLICSQH